ncbi:MAG: hypothetical protein CMD54_06625 [Gammaproteobacteria bacterium]|nr:hypothetical protein [Gammaproteobacteria bacterium]HAN79826.1 hypothetical protein [Gammaproteobacteria bacterium]
MNPWIAHLENQDLKWIVDFGQGIYCDPGVSVLFPNPTLILYGELECRGHVRGSGALLGISEWYLEAERSSLWQVTMPVWGLELPLTQKHRRTWSIALAIAMSAEIRLSQPDASGLADVEAAQLKFRYVVGQLETTLWGI